jgi:REP element-mobilizing transposase RayT
MRCFRLQVFKMLNVPKRVGDSERERDQYRHLAWSSLRVFPISVLAYCVTSNHTHFLVRSESGEAVSQWIQRLDGEFAQAYNRRKGRSGAFWSDRYHCTMIEDGPHLWNGMVYIDLNMMRAGVVSHPAQWPWCSYSEWAGLRRQLGFLRSRFRPTNGAGRSAVNVIEIPNLLLQRHFSRSDPDATI